MGLFGPTGGCGRQGGDKTGTGKSREGGWVLSAAGELQQEVAQGALKSSWGILGGFATTWGRVGGTGTVAVPLQQPRDTDL